MALYQVITPPLLFGKAVAWDTLLDHDVQTEGGRRTHRGLGRTSPWAGTGGTAWPAADARGAPPPQSRMITADTHGAGEFKRHTRDETSLRMKCT